MSKLRKIVYLSDTQYQTLITNGSVTSNGQTVVYDANDIYLTPSSNTSGGSSSASSVPSGGNTGQVLMKNSNADQDVKWGTISKVSQADSVPWSGVSNTPTTLSGYGITDALTANSSLNAAKLTGTIPASCYTNTTYNIATNSVSGLVKPWYTHTAASTGPTTGSNATAIAVNTISTTAGKYYAVEADSNGRLFVNVPWISGASGDYVQKSGDTMTGNLTLSKSNPAFKAIDSTVDEDFGTYLTVSSNHMTHGVYSTGYSTKGTAATFTSDRKWMVYRDATGNIFLNGTANKATQDGDGNTITSTYVKKSGDTMTGNLYLGTYDLENGRVLLFRGKNTDGSATRQIWLGYANGANSWYLYDTTNNKSIITSTSAGVNTFNGTANQATKDSSGNTISSTYVKIAGDTMTGNLIVSKDSPQVKVTDTTNNDLTAALIVGNGHQNHGLYSYGYAPTTSTFTSNGKWIIYRGSDGEAHSDMKIYGAVWNDYAEYRKDNPKEEQEPGRCVCEVGDGTLALTTKRLERGCEIISDTYGFAIGQDEENGYNTPIASNGRVLAYPYESIEEFASHIGYPVCSGPDGTVSIMTDEEEEKYPSRIIGTISEIPSYEEWGTGKVKVNGRVWIRIR